MQNDISIYKRTDIKISFACNNMCKFCVQGTKRNIFGPKSIERIKNELISGRKNGACGLVITGGEPTVNKNIFDIIKLAKKLGYEDIQIQTNGRMFKYSDFCSDIKKAGATEISPALHGSNPEIHDYLTSVPGSFKETAEGIINAKKYGFRIITNSVVTKPNMQNLPALASLLCALGVSQFQFAFVHIQGRAAENAKWLIAKKTAAAPFIMKAIDIGVKKGIPVFTEAIPYCILKGYETHIAERIIPDTQIFDAESEIRDFTEFRRGYGKIKGPKCKKCVYYKQCEGPWKEYPELFGWEEFIPRKSY